MSDPQSITVYAPDTGVAMITFTAATKSGACDLYDEWVRRTSMLTALEAMTEDGEQS